jgi:hypothetical protein
MWTIRGRQRHQTEGRGHRRLERGFGQGFRCRLAGTVRADVGAFHQQHVDLRGRTCQHLLEEAGQAPMPATVTDVHQAAPRGLDDHGI